MKIICYASKKGGVSKTTSAIITALMLAEKKKVLLIDLDSQNALTSFFFEDINEIQGKTIYEFMKSEIEISNCIFSKGNLDVIPCGIEFEEITRLNRAGKELLLKRALRKLKYDYVIIDTPPSLNTETIIGLACANIIIIPAKLEKMDARAIDFTIHKIDNEIRDLLNEDIKKIFILPTHYSFNNRTVNDLAFETLKEKYPTLLVNFKIPLSSKVSQFNFIGYQKGVRLGSFKEYRKVLELL